MYTLYPFVDESDIRESGMTADDVDRLERSFDNDPPLHMLKVRFGRVEGAPYGEIVVMEDYQSMVASTFMYEDDRYIGLADGNRVNFSSYIRRVRLALTKDDE